MGGACCRCIYSSWRQSLFASRHCPHTTVSADEEWPDCQMLTSHTHRVPFTVKRLNAACGIMITGVSLFSVIVPPLTHVSESQSEGMSLHAFDPIFLKE